MSLEFTIKSVKQRLTRQLNELTSMHVEAEQFKELWKFPTNREQLENYILTNKTILSDLINQIKLKEEKLTTDYSTYVGEIELLKREDKERGDAMESEFDHYWETKRGDQILDMSSQLRRKLEIRLLELECQEKAAKRDADKRSNISVSQAIMSQAAAQEAPISGQSNGLPEQGGAHSSNASIPVPPQSQMFRYLYGHELRIPEFHGNPEEFDSFWELFEELVHKQPYSDLEKLSILLSSCKGDAERALRMIPRNGHSYALAVTQLKSQFQDVRRNKTILLRKLQALPKAGEDPRQLQNTYNDVLALVAEMRKQNEAVDSTGLLQTVLSKFSRSIQDEAAKREYDSRKIWSMSDLMENLDILVKRRVHVGFKTGGNQELQSFTTLNIQSKHQALYCVGCNGAHRFLDCNKYRDTYEKRERLKQLKVCWICFSKRHQSDECHRQRCLHCAGAHHTALCNRQPAYSNRRTNYRRQRTPSPFFKQERRRRSPEPLQRYKNTRSSSPAFRPRAQSPNINFKNARPYTRSPVRDNRQKSDQCSKKDYMNQRTSRSPSTSPTRNGRNRVRFVTFTTSKQDFNSPDKATVTLGNEKELLSSESLQCTRLMTVPVNIRNNKSGQLETVMALLDSASDSSFITEEAIKRLNLNPYSEKWITVTTFGGRAYQRRTEHVEVTLFNYNGEAMETTLLSHERITKPLHFCDLTEEDIQFLNDNFIVTEDLLLRQTTIVPEILLGIDYFNSIFMIDSQPIKLPSGFYVTSTFFGHVISGSHSNRHGHFNCWGNHSLTVDVEDLYRHYEMFQSNENELVNAPTQQQETEQIMNNFNSTVQIRKHRIFVKFPWKENKSKLSDNFNLALSRLHQQFKLSWQNPRLWEQYCKIIDEQLRTGIIEEVQDKHKAETPLYYIPHQAVLKPSSHTTKVRIVLDASSKQKGELSLNDVIHQGPMLLPSLLGILIRARIGSRILIADVEKAFHTIYLQETERDAVRFLWLKDTNKPPTYHNVKIMRFQRLAFGINASPSLLAMSIKYYLDNEMHSQISQEIIRNLYVDNVLLSAESTEEAINKYLLSKQIFKDMSMNLREYISNDPQCNEKIDLNDIANHKDHRILGIAWDPDQDQLKLKSKLKYMPIPTKRSVLQAIHSTFDPLGLLTPLLLNARIFMQDLWQKSYKWDTPLSEEDAKSWRNICDEACDFYVVIPRKITTHSQSKEHQIHTFVDASMRSYAACVYMRTKTNDSIESHLLIARSRLSPKKTLQNQSSITIPRLELMALEMGMKLTEFVLNEIDLNINSVYIYCDSQIVLCWVNTTKPKNKNGTFVSNRVAKIKESLHRITDKGIECQIKYIPTEKNPADYATRGTNSAEIIKFNWMKGPTFLAESKLYTNEDFPLCITAKNEDAQIDEEKQADVKITEEQGIEVTEEIDRNESSTELATHMTCTNAEEGKQLLVPVLSTWFKTKRAMANILRFIKHRIANRISEENRQNLCIAIPELSDIRTEHQRQEINTEEIDAAEKCIIKMIQRQFKILTDKQRKLNPLPDPEGILRCFGRLQMSSLPEKTRNPILLPPNHPITKLIIEEYHEKTGHQGVNGTIANIRTKFWIPTARQIVRKTLNSCIICKRWHAKPYLYPNSPSLPLCRSSASRPFEHAGVDFAGPFYVRAIENSIIKVWTCLFTCMVTRAVHLEMVEGLSAEAFVNCLRRFVARRGVPTSIISDNATNFQLGQEIINEKTTQNDVASTTTINTFLCKNQIQWKFITPLSPWKGGFYERLIGIMKLCLRKIIGRRQLTAPNFQTFLTEAEAMINTRPLAYAGSNIDDSLIIRPIDFLIPRAQLNLMKEQEESGTEYIPHITRKSEAEKYLAETNNYLTKMWSMWREQYLLELRNYHEKRIRQRSFTRKIPHIGEVVLIMDEKVTRGCWPMGLVTHTIEGPDGEIREVQLRTAFQKSITRSVNMLVPLELDESSNMRIQERPTDETTEKSSAPESNTERRENYLRERLPRKAKENVHYTLHCAYNNTKAQRKASVHSPWQAWLYTVFLISLFTQATAHKETLLKTECILGGIKIYGLETQTLQVCGEHHCMELRNSEENVTIQFPPEVILHKHNVLIKTLSYDTTQAFQFTCPPSPFCEQIKCTFCNIMISNPHCWPKTTIIVIAIFIYSTLMTITLSLLCVNKARRCLCTSIYKTATFMLRIVHACYKRGWNTALNNENTPLVEVRSHPNEKWKPSALVKIITIAMICANIITMKVIACQQTIALQSDITQCSSADTCTKKHALLLKINSLQPEACFHIKRRNITISQTKISLKEVILRCNKESLYYTRNTETRVQYSKRCPHMGTCSGSKCAKITTDSKIEELAMSNNFTGRTYCTESCGGLGCSCGFPSSGCLFYRIYHVPTDNEIYEVFHCPTWSLKVALSITKTNFHQKPQTHTMEFEQNVQKYFDGMSIEITSIQIPTMPLLGDTFIESSKMTVRLKQQHTFSYACVDAKNVSSLRKKEECTIHDTCSCRPAEDSVNCYCTHNNLSQILELSQILPIKMPNALINAEGKHNTLTIRTLEASIEVALLVNTSESDIRFTHTQFQCRIPSASILGCYNCLKDMAEEESPHTCTQEVEMKTEELVGEEAPQTQEKPSRAPASTFGQTANCSTEGCPGMVAMQQAMLALQQEIHGLRKEIKLHRIQRKRKHSYENEELKQKRKKDGVDSLVDYIEECVIGCPPPTTEETTRNDYQSTSAEPPRLQREEQAISPQLPPSNCVFCGRRHWSTECTVYSTLTARRERIAYLKRCERCLGPATHMATSCQPKSTCFFCKKAMRLSEMTRHHSVFCQYQFNM